MALEKARRIVDKPAWGGYDPGQSHGVVRSLAANDA
jgi:hypothetical protein